jgi:Rrf2 family protein
MISREADYALQIVLFLAQQDEGMGSCTSALLAEKLDIPYYFLRRIVKILIENDIIFSKKGRNGGISLAKDIGDISLYDVINRVHPKGIILSKCTGKRELCENIKGCALHSVFHSLQHTVDQTLKETTFKTLVKNKRV